MVRGSMGHNKFFSDLAIITLWISITIVVVLTSENTYIRTILAIPTILIIPGYILVAALFPKKDRLDIIERISLSFGLSIVIVSILGLILSFTFGIRLMSILVAIGIYTIVFVLIAVYKREKLSEDVQFNVQLTDVYNAVVKCLTPKNRTDFILTIILIFMVVSVIGTIYYTITIPKIGERFTEFYILNSSEMVGSYPTTLKLNSPINLYVGVSNHEQETTNYTIQVLLDKNVLTSKELTLDDGDTQKYNITLTPNNAGTDMKLEFLLFKDNNFTVPYRTSHLWVSTT